MSFDDSVIITCQSLKVIIMSSTFHLISIVFATVLFINLHQHHQTEARSMSKAGQNLDAIIKNGTRIAEIAAGTFSAPWALLASQLNAAAASLPSAMAVTGGSVGSFIATPLQIGASVASGVASGITGFLVSLPIALGTSVVASASEARRLLQQEIRRRQRLHHSVNATHSVHHHHITMTEPIKVEIINGSIDASDHFHDKSAADHGEHERSLQSTATSYVLAPMAVVIGTEGALLGATGLSIGEGVKYFGDEISSAGQSIIDVSKGVKGIGSTLFSWGSGGRTIPVISTDDDIYEALAAANRLPTSVTQLIFQSYFKAGDDAGDDYDGETESDCSDDCCSNDCYKVLATSNETLATPS